MSLDLEDINENIEFGRTKLYYSVLEDDLEKFKELLSNGANPFIIDEETGETLEDVTTNEEILKILKDLEKKCDNLGCSSRFLDRINKIRSDYELNDENFEGVKKIENAFFVDILRDNKTVCSFCFNSENVTKKCGKCGNEYYCNQLCQKTDWKYHKKYCK